MLLNYSSNYKYKDNQLVIIMLKSTTMLGLFLTASLIMLSTFGAAMSIGNMNLFSDAIASEINSDKYENPRNTKKLLF